MSFVSSSDPTTQPVSVALSQGVTEFALMAGDRTRAVLCFLAEMCVRNIAKWDQASGGFVLRDPGAAAAPDPGMHPQDALVWEALHRALANGTGQVKPLLAAVSPILDGMEQTLVARQLLWPGGKSQPQQVVNTSLKGLMLVWGVLALYSVFSNDWPMAAAALVALSVSIFGQRLMLKTRRTPAGNQYFVQEMKYFQAWLQASEADRRHRMTEPMTAAWVVAAHGGRMLVAFGKEKLGSVISLQHDESTLHRQNDALMAPFIQMEP
jgi:uncharacterized protein (TIGR04222 family)